MGCRPVLVLTGKGEKTRSQLGAAGVALDRPEAIPTYANLAEASRAILGDNPTE